MITIMKMLEKVWEFIKKYWLQILGLIGIAIIAEKVLEKKGSDAPEIIDAGTQTKLIVDEANKKEKEEIVIATIVAEAKQEVRDVEIKQAEIEKKETINVKVKKKIEEDVNEDISATAKKFESLGATYVKNEQK